MTKSLSSQFDYDAAGKPKRSGDTNGAKGKPSESNRRSLVVWLTATYLVVVLWLWFIHWRFVDQWWLATLLSFGPTYCYLLPVVLLSPWALSRRSIAILLLVVVAVVLFPIMGLRFGLGRSTPFSNHTNVRVLTCNVGGKTELSRLSRRIEVEQPDVVLIQESPDNAESLLDLPAPWRSHQQGRLFVASRHALAKVSGTHSPTESWRTVCLNFSVGISGHRDPISFQCLHLSTPRTGIEAVLRREAGAIRAFDEANAKRRADAIIASRLAPRDTRYAVIAGDFNATGEGRIMNEFWGDWANAFAIAGRGFGWTKHTRIHGVRIDHILTTKHCRVVECRVLEDIGSDHRPLFAVMQIPNEAAEATATDRNE